MHPIRIRICTHGKSCQIWAYLIRIGCSICTPEVHEMHPRKVAGMKCPKCSGEPIVYWKSFPEHEQQPSLHLRADCADCGTYIQIVNRSYARLAVNTPEDPVVGRGTRLRPKPPGRD